MSGGCLRNIIRRSGDVIGMSGGCHQYVWEMPTGCLGDVTRMSGQYHQEVRRCHRDV